MSPESVCVPRRSTVMCLLVTFLFSTIIHPSCSRSDPLQILLEFKSAMADSDSSSQTFFDSWNEENPVCNFTGIVCDARDSVREINLSRRRLSAGAVAFDRICSMEWLERLDLGSNRLHGTVGPQLSNCSGLRYLDLGENFFSGNFPEIASLTRLEFLNLNLSGFSGRFPWKSIENLTQITFLSLGDNPFDKTPFPSEILKLEKLQTLYLSNCSIEGRIPEEIGNLVSLKSLEISDNFLVGNIPRGITKLLNLQMLELYNNRLSGVLPVGFRNLVELSKLDVSNNSLEGDVSELRSLVRLESLQLFENGFSGTIPKEFGEFKFLRQFSIYNNGFTGELPAKIGSWADFQFIDVSDNLLTGLIPPDMCRKGKIIELLMLQNKFTGGLPESYAGCHSLRRLRLTNNSLSGRVPDGIWSLPDLNMIDLSMNRFEGQVPANIGESKSLSQLFLANNQFSGVLPEEISEVSSLVEIELDSNRFSGEIPTGIGELKTLSSLHLEGNLFSGTIPSSLGSCVSLNDLNLAGNLFSGQIPGSLGSLPSLNSLNLSGNKLSGAIPASLSALKLTLIDLSNNILTGSVPESLLVEAYNGSFAGNPGLCAPDGRDLRQCSPASHKSREFKVVIFSIIAITLVLLSFSSCLIVVKLRPQNHENLTIRGFLWDMKPFHVLSFDVDMILRCLRHENLIAKGGSGNVYKATLTCGKRLAVKHMWKPPSNLDDQKLCRNRWPEYEAEVAALSTVRHINVVKLYCSITSKDSNLLVYEYMSNGSLWDRLHTSREAGIPWDVRYEIVLGVARGLEYLHHGCDRPIIHRDVKSSNILLDEWMKPKIADFGLAKIMQTDEDVSSRYMVAGTYGYIAPEYGYTLKVTEKSDVYSFGVVLMELVTGKKPVEREFGDIVSWVQNEIRSNSYAKALVDPSIPEDSRGDAAKALNIAVHCTMKIPTLRPSMRTVVQMLEDIKPCLIIDVLAGNEVDNNKGTLTSPLNFG